MGCWLKKKQNTINTSGMLAQNKTKTNNLRSLFTKKKKTLSLFDGSDRLFESIDIYIYNKIARIKNITILFNDDFR